MSRHELEALGFVVATKSWRSANICVSTDFILQSTFVYDLGESTAGQSTIVQYMPLSSVDFEQSIMFVRVTGNIPCLQLYRWPIGAGRD
jgi:hypothetical protein